MGIYQIICVADGRVYVGSSDVIRRRWRQHRNLLRGNRHHNYLLQAAWNEYGEGAFTFTMIEVITDLDLLIPAEQRCLNAAKAAGETFNIAQDIAAPYRGLVHTEQARIKMSIAIKASMTPERLQAMSERVQGEQNPGGKLTDAIVLDIVRRLLDGEHPKEVAAALGVVQETVYQIRSGRIWTHIVTAEQVAAMMEINQYGTRWAGVEITEEMREHGRRLGQSNKGRRAGPETLAKLSDLSRGDANPKAKLDEARVRQIKCLLARGARNMDLSVQFGVAANQISRIKNGESWAHVVLEDGHAGDCCDLPVADVPPRVFTPEERQRVSDGLKGKPKSAEHRANLWRNREVTDGFRDQMAVNGARQRGRPKSAETRAKMSAAQAGGRALLTDAKVREIKRMLAVGERPAVIAERFGITRGAVSSIKTGRSHANVTIT